MLDRPLSTKELEYLKVHSRLTQGWRRINVSPLESELTLWLTLDPCPSTVSALSALTGYTRRSVRLAMLDLETMGLAHRVSSGWTLTDTGRRLLGRLVREMLDVAMRDAMWLSEGLLSELRGLPSEGVVKPFKVD